MIFVTSDLHFGHANMIRYCNRPYSDVDNMNRLLVMNWNEVVGTKDRVYILGDFAMGHRQETVPIAKQLNGEKYLVPGNHDGCWIGHGNPERVASYRAMYEDAGLKVLPSQVVLTWEGIEYLMCHFPYREVVGEYDARFAEHHPVDRHGLRLLHGHVHKEWKTNGPRMVNVGIDVWNQTPVSMDLIVKEFDQA